LKTFITFPALLVAVLAGIALADVGTKNGGATVGPVRDLDAALDGGLTLSRASGSSTGSLKCASATASTPGCVDTGAQTFAGKKTFSSEERLANIAHASLPVCSGGEVAYCTTHGSITQCKDIGGGVKDWVDLFGSTGGGVTLATLGGNRMLHSLSGYFGTFTLPYPYTIKRISAVVLAGSGAAATISVRFSSLTGNCDCAVACDANNTISDCTGNCTFAADTQVVATTTANGCTNPPTLRSDIVVSGYK
jgi:hypothetical protein